MNAKKIIRQDFDKLFVKLIKIKDDMESIKDNSKHHRLSIDEFNTYLQEYLRLYGEIAVKIEGLGKQYSSLKKWANELFSQITDDLRLYILHELRDILSVKSNIFFKAKSPNEIPRMTRFVEKRFDYKVQQAVEFFGDSFLISELGKPYPDDEIVTLADILDQNRSDWTSHIIINGCPQPLYKEFYMRKLEAFSYNYIVELENTAILKERML